MSLYSHGFTFLPRPERSLLSFGNETTRAQLPDFQNVTELSNFVERLMIYQFPIEGIYIQIKFCASFVCLLLLIVVGILSGRVYENTFWIIRAMKRPSGTVLVPNSMLAFSLVEGLYGILFVALFWELVVFFQRRSSLPTNFICWIQLPWIPLIIGASMAAWGTYFAIPTTTQQAFGVQSQKSSFRIKFQQIISHSLFINAATLFTPFSIVVSIVIPTVLGNIRWNSALQKQQEWLKTYSNSNEFSQEMIFDAQKVWYQLLPAMKYSGISMILWTVWALAIFITYSIIAIRLVLTVKRELFKVENAKGAYRGFAVSTYHGEPGEGEKKFDPIAELEKKNRLQHANALHRDRDEDDNVKGALGVNFRSDQFLSPNTMISDSPNPNSRNGYQNSNVTLDRKNSDATVLNESALRHSNSKSALVPNDSLNRTNNVGGPGTDLSNSDEDLANVLDRAIPMQFDEEGAIETIRQTKNREKKSNGENGENDSKKPTKRSFLPKNLLLHHRHAHGTTKQMGANGRAQQKDALRKAFVHVCIQAIAISPACLLFMCIACAIAVGNYGGTEQPKNGGNYFEYIICYALTFAMWTTVVFGSITLFAIAFRTYESVLTVVSFPSMSGGQGSSGGGNGGTAKSPKVIRNGIEMNSSSSGQRSNVDSNVPGSPRTFESNERSWRRLSIPLSLSKKNKNNNSNRNAEEGLGIGMETSFFETETRHQPSQQQSRNGRVVQQNDGGGDLTYEMSSLNSHSYRKDNFTRMNEMEIGPLESFAEMPKEDFNNRQDHQFNKRTVGTIREASFGGGGERHQPRAYRRNDDDDNDDEGSQWSPSSQQTSRSPNHSSKQHQTKRQKAPQEPIYDETQSYSDPEEERRYFQGGAGRRRTSLKGSRQTSQK